MLGSIGPHHPEPAFSTVAHDAHRGAHVDNPAAIRRNLYVGRVLELKDVEIREWSVLRGGRDGRQERDRASGDEDADHWCLPCEVAPKVRGVARLREPGRGTGGVRKSRTPLRPCHKSIPSSPPPPVPPRVPCRSVPAPRTSVPACSRLTRRPAPSQSGCAVVSVPIAPQRERRPACHSPASR